MKLEISDKYIKLIPEDSEDMFMIGRISKNMKCRIIKNKQHLQTKITDFEIAITDALEMLAEGIIPKENEDE